MNSMQRKKTELIARTVINKLSGIKFIGFENDSSIWVDECKSVLEQFHSLDSISTDFIKAGKNRDEYVLWAQSTLSFFNGKKEWLILVPNCNEPIWANVFVINFNEVIASLWDTSECNEFVIVDKKSQQIAAIFNEEKSYELHKAMLTKT
jgi:hypothetical protein